MKVGIVGAGFVGATAAYALVMRGIGSEIVLVDRNTERARAEADDILHAVAFAHPARVSAGDYADLADARVVIIAAGVSQKPGENRRDLLGRNAAVFASVVPSILDVAPDAVLVVATNPVDAMTHYADACARARGARPGQVFGTGTMLDTARFRALIGGLVGVDAQHVHGYVLGEHGDSEVLAWSSASVAGIPLQRFCADRGIDPSSAARADIDETVRRAAYRIIEGKGSTYYGIGSAIARVVGTVLADRHSVLTVCAPAEDVAGIGRVTLSLPRLVTGRGIGDTYDPELDPREFEALMRSAQEVQAAIDEIEAASSAC